MLAEGNRMQIISLLKGDVMEILRSNLAWHFLAVILVVVANMRWLGGVKNMERQGIQFV